MDDVRDADIYRQRAADMRAQAERAETPYLRGVYEGIAERWADLFRQMESGCGSRPGAT
jgi:hypothetical protein